MRLTAVLSLASVVAAATTTSLTTITSITGATVTSTHFTTSTATPTTSSRRTLFTSSAIPQVKNATGVTTITSPGGVSIRYKQPEKEGVCETTPGVNTYSGYVDLDNDTHMFFWFVESRKDPANSPLTLWLNGGPGSDSLIGFFQELGPCNVTKGLETMVNPYAWNEVSNMLFLSQPIGVGFSYSNISHGSYFGSRPTIADDDAVGTTDQAAVGAWHVLQGFLANLPTLDPKIKVQKFNLWTESYGGHYGPSFYSHFKDQNNAIKNGTQKGVPLVMDTLGIINGIIDSKIQTPYYPEFAVNNTYGIKAVNDTIYKEMKAAFSDPGMCSDQIDACAASDRTTLKGQSICMNATTTCREYVEGPYYDYNHGVYDIRHPKNDPEPPTYFIRFLNLEKTQNALGVSLNYTSQSNSEVASNFRETGDFVYGTFKKDLETLLDAGVRVALFYGDADYICNWFGGEALSLALNFTTAPQFRAVPYSPFTVSGKEYGQVRQYGNFSFARIYAAGHEIPYYQPEASLEFFRRVLNGKAVSDGVAGVSGVVVRGSATTGTSTATGTGGAVSPTSSKSAGSKRVKMFWRR
ncbi:Alpha/Beta hydrolase protein [Halenospora varia]|nr:Alpha/Beta hydrolase protein [Halenospora varia]